MVNKQSKPDSGQPPTRTRTAVWLVLLAVAVGAGVYFRRVNSTPEASVPNTSGPPRVTTLEPTGSAGSTATIPPPMTVAISSINVDTKGTTAGGNIEINTPRIQPSNPDPSIQIGRNAGHAPPASYPSIDGTYKGTLWQGVAPFDVTTTIWQRHSKYFGQYVVSPRRHKNVGRTADGKFAAYYEIEPGKLQPVASAHATTDPYAGILADGNLMGSEIEFTWHDHVSKDKVRFKFADGNRGFTGTWYIKGQSAGTWTGTR